MFGQVSDRFVQAVSQRYVIIHVLLGRVVTFGQVSGRFVQAVKSKICDCSCIIRHSSNVWAGVWPFCSSCKSRIWQCGRNCSVVTLKNV